MEEQGITRLIFESSRKENNSNENFHPNVLFNSGSESSQLIDSAFEQEKKRAFEQGYKESIEKAQSEWNSKINLMDSLLIALESPLKNIDLQIQEKSAELAIAIAKQIVRRELTLDSGQIVSVVKQAIELIPRDGQEINIHINPNDSSHINELFSNNEKTNKYNVIQDPTISMGGCKASTDYSLVDLTIDKQIATISAQIFGDQRNGSK